MRLERSIEEGVAEALGLRTDVFVRSAEEWAALVERNPFPAEARANPAHLTLWVLKDPPSVGAEARLRARIVGPERFRTDGRPVYLVYPDGIRRSRVTAAVVERALETRVTARNWNTVTRLEELSKSVGRAPPGSGGDRERGRHTGPCSGAYSRPGHAPVHWSGA